MRVLKVKGLQEKLSVSQNTIWNWARETDFPKPFKVNGVTYWDEDEVDQWLQQKKEMQNGSSGKENGDQRADLRPTDCVAQQTVG